MLDFTAQDGADVFTHCSKVIRIPRMLPALYAISPQSHVALGDRRQAQLWVTPIVSPLYRRTCILWKYIGSMSHTHLYALVVSFSNALHRRFSPHLSPTPSLPPHFFGLLSCVFRSFICPISTLKTARKAVEQPVSCFDFCVFLTS